MCLTNVREKSVVCWIWLHACKKNVKKSDKVEWLRRLSSLLSLEASSLFFSQAWSSYSSYSLKKVGSAINSPPLQFTQNLTLLKSASLASAATSATVSAGLLPVLFSSTWRQIPQVFIKPGSTHKGGGGLPNGWMTSKLIDALWAKYSANILFSAASINHCEDAATSTIPCRCYYRVHEPIVFAAGICATRFW